MGVDQVILLTGYLISTALGAYATYQKVRAGRLAESVQQADDAIATMAAAIELLPQSAMKGTLKRRVAELGLLTGVEYEKIAPIVQDISVQLAALGRLEAEDDEDSRDRALVAVRHARDKRAQRKLVLSGATPLHVLLILCLGLAVGLSSCAAGAAVAAPRLTSEQVIRGEDGTVTDLAVEWPAGVSRDPEDFVTVEVDGRMITTVQTEQ